MESMNSSAVDDHAENIVSDMDSIHSHDHNDIHGDYVSSDVEDENFDDGSGNVACGLLDDASNTGVNGRKAGVDGKKEGVTATRVIEVSSPTMVQLCDPGLQRRIQHTSWEDMVKMILYSHSWMPMHNSRS